MTNNPQLPLFEGITPHVQLVKVTGTGELAGALLEPHHIGEMVYVTAALEVTKIGHEFNKDGALERVETLKLDRFAFTGDAGDISAALAEKRAEAGITELPLDQ